jgi:hypothetical protein
MSYFTPPSPRPPSTIPLSATRAFYTFSYFPRLIGGIRLLPRRHNWRQLQQLSCHCSGRSQAGPRLAHPAGWCQVQACRERAPCIAVVSAVCFQDKGRDRGDARDWWYDGHVVDESRREFNYCARVQWNHRSCYARRSLCRAWVFMNPRRLPGWAHASGSVRVCPPIA